MAKVINPTIHGAVQALGEQMTADSKAWFAECYGRGDDASWRHAAFGLGGETGEVLDVLKKADICGFVSTCSMHSDGKHDMDALAAEMADVLTYLLVLATLFGIDLVAAWEAKRIVNVERWGDPS